MTDQTVKQLDHWSSEEHVYRELPRLSGGAAKFVLALLTYHARGGPCGKIVLNDIVKGCGNIPAVIDELAARGMAMKDDKWHWHPALFAMMAPARPQRQQASSTDTNIIPFPTAS